MMKLAPLVLLLALFGNANASGGPCACETEELGWKIDCDDTDAMEAALTFLAGNSCASDCSSEACEMNYYIVQAHHDYCPEEGLPESVEDGFHDYDEICTHCGIKRAFVDGAPDCPLPNCEDQSGNDAYTALISGGCNIDCSSAECKSLFGVLLITHDACPHDVLSDSAEKGYHDLERSCADAVCNDISGKGYDPLVCDEDAHDHGSHDHGSHDHSDHDSDDSAGVARTATGAVATLAAAVLLA